MAGAPLTEGSAVQLRMNGVKKTVKKSVKKTVKRSVGKRLEASASPKVVRCV